MSLPHRSPNSLLLLSEIALLSAREALPPVSQEEVLLELIRSFWRAELFLVGGPTRLQLLKALHQSNRDSIDFVMPDARPERIREDTTVTLGASVRVPNDDPQSWSDENCAFACENARNIDPAQNSAQGIEFAWK